MASFPNASTHQDKDKTRNSKTTKDAKNTKDLLTDNEDMDFNPEVFHRLWSGFTSDNSKSPTNTVKPTDSVSSDKTKKETEDFLKWYQNHTDHDSSFEGPLDDLPDSDSEKEDVKTKSKATNAASTTSHTAKASNDCRNTCRHSH